MEPVHVHISKGKPSSNSTKVWLTKAGGCILGHNKSRIPEKDLKYKTINKKQIFINRSLNEENLYFSYNHLCLNFDIMC